MKIAKIRDVKTPTRGDAGSAGLDFYVPNDWNEGKALTLTSGQDVLIPTGLKVEVPRGYAFLALNKSGVSTKQKLDIGATVVDESYQGELHMHVFNFSYHTTIIEPGQKLVQFVLVPVLYADVELIEEEYIHIIETERGSGGFGSTGIK